MDEAKKKPIMIGVAVACIALAVIITMVGSDDSGGSKKPVQMLCVNPKCAHTYELSQKGFKQQMLEKGPVNPMAGPPVLTCPECDKNSGYIATKCQECEHVFMPKYNRKKKDFRDRCPECNYSKLEAEGATR